MQTHLTTSKSLLDWQTIIIITLLSVVCCTMVPYAHAIDSKAELVFKSVRLNADCGKDPDYERGADRFPSYLRHGLPECFLIKRSPDLSIPPADIKRVTIKCMPSKTPFGNNPAARESYLVTIDFTESALNAVHTYTEAHVRSRVSIEIGNDILIIPTIINPIESSMTITISDKRFSEIKNIMSKICSDIEVEENNNEKA